MKPRVRFAPSPTGHLHVGGARTALFNWLFARHGEGDFILRIEDTDQTRSTKQSIDQIKESLNWLDLDWDEYSRQTKRSEVYRKTAEKLKNKGKVYRSEGALWFEVPQTGQIKIEDLVMGQVEYNMEEFKDFVIRRSDGTFTYNFACVVDDVEMKITHVMRGDDHLNNTPKQLLVYKALNEKPPRFAHLPMILGRDEKRLSKRHGASSVLSYKKRGFLPQALINFLARLGWSHGDQEIFTTEELIELFSIENVGSAPAVFDEEKLLWLNHHWLKEKDPSDLVPLLKRFLIQEEIASDEEIQEVDQAKLERAIALLRERNKTLAAIAHASRFIFADNLLYNKKLITKYFTEETKELLAGLAQTLEEIPGENFNKDELESRTRDFLAGQNKDLGAIAQPCRIAITGRPVSPGLFATMELTGKEKTVSRIKQLAQI